MVCDGAESNDIYGAGVVVIRKESPMTTSPTPLIAQTFASILMIELLQSALLLVSCSRIKQKTGEGKE